jgi:hypothetical protein
MSCRVTGLIRSLCAMRFLSFITLTMQVYDPFVRSPQYKGRALHLCFVPSFPVDPVVRLLLFFGASTLDKTVLI